jgi:hypothetical protein
VPEGELVLEDKYRQGLQEDKENRRQKEKPKRARHLKPKVND